MAQESLAKIVAAREYIPSVEVQVQTDMGPETLLVPVDKNAATSQNHITVALAQRAWDATAVKMINRKDVTPKEIKDMVEAAKAIVDMRAMSYAHDRPANLPMLGSTAQAIGEGIGKALTDSIAAGATKESLTSRLARAVSVESEKPLEA